MKPPLTHRQARVEAERCLQCFDAPCTASCPAHIDIPTFIAMIRSDNLAGAAEVVKSSNALANVCGKVCPEEIFCQAVCNRGKQDTPIAIRELHFHATRSEYKRGYSDTRAFRHDGRLVAVIGGGPAGLACAFELVKLGHRVDLYDRHLPGGVPRNSIPLFRLSTEEVLADVDFLSRFFEIRQESVDRRRFAEIRGNHDASFLATGLSVDRTLPIRGAELPGVVPVLEFLESAKSAQQNAVSGKRVVIIGGGNVSLDAASTAKRMGCKEVILIYRRGEKEMRVWKSELEEARGSGVQIQFFTNPVEIIGRTRVEGVRCRRTRLTGSHDATNRPIPEEIADSELSLETDLVIAAIGQVPAGDILDLFQRNAQGYLNVDETFATSVPGVFAGGDIVGGEGTIVQSVEQGKKAAHTIHHFLSRSMPA
jgi:NADPH-dependent glutamate synthase beta subunit-like oxidoreductase